MSYQILRKFLGSTGAIASLIFITPTAIAQLPPLSPNQTDLLNNFRREYGESPFLLQRNEPFENPNDSFTSDRPLLEDSTIPLSERQIVEVSSQQFQEICRSDPQAANVVRKSDGRLLLVGCDK